MPVMPRSGQLARREQSQQAQRERVEEMPSMQRMMYQRQQAMQQQARAAEMQAKYNRAQQQQPQQPALTADQRHALRRQNVLTAQEVEEGVEDGSKKGKGFRVFFVTLVLLVLGLLMLLKLDQEVKIELPESVKRLAEAGSETTATEKESKVPSLNQRDQGQIDEYLNLLHVKKEDSAVDETLAKEDRMKLKRRERKRQKQAIEKAYKEHMEGHGQLVSCGRSCQTEHQQVQLAYEYLNQQIDDDLYNIVLPQDRAKDQRDHNRFVSPNEIEEAYKARVSNIEQETAETEEAKEDKQLALEEVKEARDILLNTESRTYYQLYGLKPPEKMKKVSARHGGWGQELLLRTHFHKLILTWMSFFGSSKVDLFVVVFVFTCLFLAPALARLPQTVAMAQRMTQEWEEMAEMEKRAKGKA